MQIVDVSHRTSKSVTAKRALPRRGILLHETGGRHSLEWLQGGSALSGRPASADFLISKAGEIYMITRPGWFAYHSGVARWRLYQEHDFTINQGFVGVELENAPQLDEKINSAQYIAAGWLCRRLIYQHQISLLDIAGHYAAALPSGRKKDPLTLNWFALTAEILTSSVDPGFFGEVGELP